MRKPLTALTFIAASLFLGCGGGGGTSNPGTPPVTPQNVTITVTPPSGFSGFIGVTQTLQFVPIVSGTTNPTVTWSVNGVAGGNSSVGTVSASGLFTAPSQTPNPQKVTVTATSQADTTKSASVAVFVSRIPPHGSWQRTGPPGGTITVLAEDVSNPGTVYAGTFNAGNGGLWKSVDAGLHWAPLVTNTTLDSFPTWDIAIPASGGGKVIYVADDFGFSSDGGATWTAVRTPAGTRAMAVDPQNRAVIYLSAPGTGVLKSQDSGATWNVLPSSPIIATGTITATLHNPLAVDRTQSSTVYYGTDHGMFVSRDSGNTWSQTTTGIASADTTVRDVVNAPAGAGVVFTLAGTPTSAIADLYQSSDRGASWTLLASGLDAERVVPDLANPNILYISGLVSHAVSKSTDGGHTFTASDNGMPVGGLVSMGGPFGTLLPMSTVPNTLLSGIGGVGVFRSQDAAASWSASNQGISAWFGLAVAFDPERPASVYLATANGGGIWKSTNSGATWVNLRHNNAHAIAVDAFNSAHILAAASDEGLIESRDAGATWQAVTNLPPPPNGSAFITGITFHPNHPGTIFISTQFGGVGVIRSTDGGGSWAITNSGLTTDRAISAVAVNPQNLSILFLGTANGVFKSLDGGNSWTLKTSTLTQMISFDMKVNPLTIYINGAKSTDAGETWQTIPNAGSIVVDPSTPNSLFTVSTSLSAPRSAQWSPDGGTTWFPLNTNLGQSNLTQGFGGGGIVIAPSSPQMLFVASTSNSILSLPVGP